MPPLLPPLRDADTGRIRGQVVPGALTDTEIGGCSSLFCEMVENNEYSQPSGASPRESGPAVCQDLGKHCTCSDLGDTRDNRRGSCYQQHPQFVKEETEAQKGQAAFPGLREWRVVEPRPDLSLGPAAWL